MRLHSVALLLVVLIPMGCASSGVDLIQPELEIAQLGGTTFSMRYTGRITIRYALRIENLSGETIDLERVRLRVIGDGPYELQSGAIPVRKSVAPESVEMVEFSMWAYSYGGVMAPNEPVTLRGIAYFNSPEGKFRTVFTQIVVQPDDTVSQ